MFLLSADDESAARSSSAADCPARNPLSWPVHACEPAAQRQAAEDGADARWMRLVQAGDARGLEALYDAHHRTVLGLAYRMLGDRTAAEDALQETFLAAWRRAYSYDPARGTPRGWLLSIAHHHCIDRLRRAQRQGSPAELDEAIADPERSDVFQAAHQHMQRAEIRAALASIPAVQRQAIELAYFAGCAQQEIAALQGVPLGTVKGRLRIGLQKLRLLLEPSARAE